MSLGSRQISSDASRKDSTRYVLIADGRSALPRLCFDLPILKKFVEIGGIEPPRKLRCVQYCQHAHKWRLNLLPSQWLSVRPIIKTLLIACMFVLPKIR